MSKPEEVKSSRPSVTNTGKAGVRYRQEALESFYDGFKAGGIDAYQCSREDEGVAMAMGAFLVGKRPVALMEGSGIGMSALILARGIVQKTPTMLIIGHNSTLGERYDYHGATRLV